jgi:hypothetical protein
MMERTRLVLFAIATVAAKSVDAFSLAPPAAKTSSTNAATAGLFSGLKRASLKKQLVEAANGQDEQLVIQLVDELSGLNPTPFPTYGLGGFTGDASASTSMSPPLDGEWRLLFTNAKDAEAPARTEKKREKGSGGFEDEVREGVDITTGQRIDADAGQCINYIYAKGEKRPFDQLPYRSLRTFGFLSLRPSWAMFCHG